MGWFKSKPQLKEEHRMQEEWEQVCQPDPPQGGDATLPVSPYTGESYDPEWGVQLPRGPRANPSLISKVYR